MAEVFYASATASAIAYKTYIYAQTPKDKFQMVTGYTGAATLAGGGLGHITGQILISTGLCDYSSVNYISLAFVVAASIVALFLPSAQQSIYFHRTKRINKPLDEAASDDPLQILPEAKAPSPWRLLWIDFTSSYSNGYMIKWSIWFSFAMCGYLMALTYIQALWDAVDGDPLGNNGSAVLNGAVEAANTLLSLWNNVTFNRRPQNKYYFDFAGALAVFAFGYVRVNWVERGELIVGCVSIFEGFMLFFAGLFGDIWVVYCTYVIFSITYHVLVTYVR